MALNLKVGEKVFVPRASVGLNADELQALYETEVVKVIGRSIDLKMPRGANPKTVDASKILRRVGVLVLRIGDFSTETGLLNPLAQSITQFCKLLLTDDFINVWKIRTIGELTQFWDKEHRGVTHVFIVAHGRPDGLYFAVDGWVTAAKLDELLSNPDDVEAKTFISLACKTGHADFSKPFSRSKTCQFFIAPFHPVPGAVASQFFQTLIADHFLNGVTIPVAFRHARAAVAGEQSFRFWQNGSLKPNV